MPNGYVWGIFVVDASSGFPNFFPIGIYTTRELAINELEALPRDQNYQLLRMPLNMASHTTIKKVVSWLEWMRSIMNIFITKMKVKLAVKYEYSVGLT